MSLPKNAVERAQKENAKLANQAHANGRHEPGAAREDIEFWAKIGCVECQKKVAVWSGDVTGQGEGCQGEGVVAVYQHKVYGGTITVYADGSMDARNAEGKRKKTSATPEKLAQGHGGWEKVS